MSVWFATPSVRPHDEANSCIQEWRRLGYKVALLRQGSPIECELSIHTTHYLGLPISINTLCREILKTDTQAKWIVTGGDDYWPDPQRDPADIDVECTEHFRGTFGVMQPTGDRYGNGYIDDSAASAWMGRDWCWRMYQGEGPVYRGYFHYYTDTELQEVAILQGRFWQRQDIVQEHRHWTRRDGLAPEFMAEPTAKSTLDQTLFESRRKSCFPGHLPL